MKETIGHGNWGSISLDAQGVPHVSFCDTEQHVLRFAVRSEQGWTTTTLDSTGDVGQYSSLGFAPDGSAHVAYYERTSARLKHAHRPSAVSPWVVQEVDPQKNAGEWASLDIDKNSDVHIAYFDAAHTALRYATTRRPVAVQPGSWTGMKEAYRGGTRSGRPKP